jgi:hypothetical protein
VGKIGTLGTIAIHGESLIAEVLRNIKSTKVNLLTRFECSFTSFPLASSVFLKDFCFLKLTYEIEKLINDVKETRGEDFVIIFFDSFKEVKTTLETSGEDGTIHSKRVEKIGKYTRNGAKRVEKMVCHILKTSMD